MTREGESGARARPLSLLLEELARAPSETLLPTWVEEPRPGERIGRFEIRKEIGRGGFGAVFEAEDGELGRRVALKALRPHRTGVQLSAEWVRREGEAVAKLDHPCIVTLFDAGTSERGPFLVMELLRGESAAQRLSRGPLAADEALRVSLQIAQALAHAHERGILHRDLKPANVFLCDDGRVKLLDFGLAHLLGTPGSSGGGTPGYMAPEQARGEEIDARADVYAAAMTLREMLAGRREPGPDAPVPRSIARAIDGALSEHREDRPRDGAAWLAELVAAQAAIERPRKVRRVATFALAASVLASGVAFLAWERGRVSVLAPEGPPSVAVLAFADMSPGGDPDYFSDGIAEEILGALNRVPGLRVPARASSFWFKGKDVEPAEIARRLGVAHLLDGAIRRSGNRIRVSAELVRASSGERVWSQAYERDLHEVFAIQDDIARSVVLALGPVLAAGSALPPAARTTDPEAYRLFLLGRFQNSQGTDESLRKSVEALERSAAIDPRYAPTQSLLAFAYRNQAGNTTVQGGADLRRAAMQAAERAVALDPSSAWGYASRGMIRLQEADWAGATADLDRAFALEPSRDFVLNARGAQLAGLGRTREAVEVQRRAVELDPLNAIHTVNLAHYLVSDGQYAEAREWALRSLELSPGYSRALWTLGWAELYGGDAQAALTAFQKTTELYRMVGTAAALHALGRAQESREALSRLESAYPDEAMMIAGARAGCGDADGAIDMLHRALRERASDLYVARSWMVLRSIRDHPRFARFVDEMNVLPDRDDPAWE